VESSLNNEQGFMEVGRFLGSWLSERQYHPGGCISPSYSFLKKMVSRVSRFQGLMVEQKKVLFLLVALLNLNAW